jgi:hypothetical protein
MYKDITNARQADLRRICRCIGPNEVGGGGLEAG